MKLYNALIKKDQSHKISDIILLEDGFSWTAFFFNLPWFLFHKMWSNSIILLLVNILFIQLNNAGIISKTDILFLDLALAVLIATNANYWYNLHLRAKGYEEIEYVLANSQIEAHIKAVELMYSENPQLNFDDFSGVFSKKIAEK